MSDRLYENPLFDNETEIELTHSDGTVLTVPGFWDGGSLWRFRFALNKEGEWNYVTRCTDSENTSLVRSGRIVCKPYSGDLPIYKHGFVGIQNSNRYFTYADGTPFFYLGDTHWTMPTEEYYTAGENAGDISTDSQFKYIVKTRAEQGFTVYQSEPIDAGYILNNGLDNDDIAGFRDLDRRFKYIAECGLVHANSQLFFANELSNYPEKYSEEYLEKLSRYWVARYCAYPVMWTTAQECDNDFYNSRGDQKVISVENNPWKTVLAAVCRYDPYNHPGSAHMEYSSFDGNGTVASTSSFRDVRGHNWYAAQWSPSLTDAGNTYDISRDYWYNGQNKVIVNYEGRYENLWTKNFGARAQGWISYLSGMYGYGYGCEDMWYYKSEYDMFSTSNDGVDTVTPADKRVKWSEAISFKTPAQLKFMRDFLELNSFHTLVPRFDDKEWVRFGRSGCGVLASDGNDTYVAYFYGKSTVISTTLKGLDSCDYTRQWFNPRTGEYKECSTVRSVCGKLHIAAKPDKNDWVLLVKKA